MKLKKGIRRKILLNTLIVILIVSGVLMGTMTYFMGTLTDEILVETLRPMAKIAAQSVEGNLHMMADRLFMLRDNTVLTNIETPMLQKQEYLDHAKAGIEFVWLALYLPSGNLYAGSDGSPADIRDRSMLKMMEATSNLVIEDTVVGKEGLEFAIGTPVYSDVDGEIAYYLVGSYKYDVINDIMSAINLGTNGKAFIINENGKLIAHRDSSLVLNNQSIEDIVSAEGLSSLKEQMIMGQTGASMMNSEDGNQLFAYAPIRGTHWSLAVTAPRDDFMAPANNAILYGISITSILVILAILFTLHLSSRIQRPLSRVTSRIGTLSQGDLHADIQVFKTGDETESLSLALSDTVKNLNQYITELSRVMTELSNSNLNVTVGGSFSGDFVTMKDSLNQIINFLNEIMQSLQNASIQVSGTSHLVSQSADHVQKSSESQSDSLSLLTDETKLIGKNIDEIDSHTTKVNQLIEKASALLSDGDAHMKNLLNSMSEITKNSDEITKINKFLEDISFQTNILALNAAVEAARAGSAGKGFAVVAEEVRSLAAKSGDSSHRTSEIIENSAKSVETGTEFANQTAKSLDGVLKSVSEISQIIRELMEAVTAQKKSLSEMTNQIGTINDLARENLKSSHTSAEASQTLTSQADTLNKIASQFTLRPNSKSSQIPALDTPHTERKLLK